VGDAPVLAVDAAKIAAKGTEGEARATWIKMKKGLFLYGVNGHRGNHSINQ
jgi:hypothetical protein